MTVSEQPKSAPVSAAAEMFKESVFPVDTPDFPFGANAPQDSQDFQDHQRQTENLTRDRQYPYENLLSLPLEDYVRNALGFSLQLTEEQAEDTWHSPLFNFARLCKAHPGITDLADYEAMDAVERVLYTLEDLPANNDPWEYYFPEAGDADSARIDFVCSWSSVRHIPFQDVLQNALRLSAKTPLQPSRRRIGLYGRFISLAGWLQVLMSGKAIYLPTRKVAGILHCDQRTVSRLRQMAIQDGLLTVIKEDSFRSSGKSTATEFRFAVEHFEELRNEQ